MCDFDVFVVIGKQYGVVVYDVVVVYGGKIDGVQFLGVGFVFVCIDGLVGQFGVLCFGYDFVYFECGV